MKKKEKMELLTWNYLSFAIYVKETGKALFEDCCFQ